jgi:hypothetical protein
MFRTQLDEKETEIIPQVIARVRNRWTNISMKAERE